MGIENRKPSHDTDYFPCGILDIGLTLNLVWQTEIEWPEWALPPTIQRNWEFSMKRRVFVTRFIAALTVVTGLTSCDQQIGSDEVTVGVVLPLSGQYALTGTGMRNAMELARSEVNASSLLSGTQLAFIIEDSESTPEGAVRAFKKLIEQDGVPAILGPYTSASTDQIISVAHQNSVVTLSPTSAAEGLGAKSPYLFRATITVGRIAPTGVRVTKDVLQYKSVALIRNSADTFSRSSHTRMLEEFGKFSDVTVVASEEYSRPSTSDLPDLSAQLTSIMNATPRPEAIFISALPPGRSGIVTQARGMGITDIPFISVLFTRDDMRRINAVQEGGANGVITLTAWIAEAEWPRSKTFVANYMAQHNQAPTGQAARSYAAVHILSEAIANAPSFDSAAIKDALNALSNHETLVGPFSFDGNGDAVYDPIVGRVKDGQFEVLGQ